MTIVKMTRNVAVLLVGSAVCLFNVAASCFDSTSTAFTLSSYNRSKKLLPPSNSIRSSSSSSSSIQRYQQQQHNNNNKKNSRCSRGRRGIIPSSACLSSLSSLLDKDDVQSATTTTFNIQQNSSSSTITSPMSTPTSSQIIIRTTQPQDLSAIVDLLSYETTTSTKAAALPAAAAATRTKSIPTFPWNWKHHISKLKSHSNLHLQLSHRLAAKLALPSPTCSSTTSTSLDNGLENSSSSSSSSSSSHNSLHSIWLNHVWIRNDAYRNKVERAVKTTLDFYKEDVSWWQDWNFALTPKREMMFHFIMTALEDMECFVGKDDVEPVGFCELMMLKRPRVTSKECVGMDPESGHEEEEEVFVPCIVNLVVSPNHRRRGIGKRLVECAVRAVRMYGKEWNVDSGVVGLFVEEDNVGAIALYESVGFRVRVDVQKKECDVSIGGQQIYMEMSMVDDDDHDDDDGRKEKKKEYDSFLSSTSREEGSRRLREQEGVAVATSR